MTVLRASKGSNKVYLKNALKYFCGKYSDKFKMAAYFRILLFSFEDKIIVYAFFFFLWTFVKLLLRCTWFWWELPSYTLMPKSLGPNLLISSHNLNYENIYLLFTYAVFSIMLPCWPSLACPPFLRTVIRILTKLGLAVNWQLVKKNSFCCLSFRR